MGERARLEILWYVTQFCLTHSIGGKNYPSSCGFVNDEFTDKPLARPGDLIVLKSAGVSPWYLSWLVEVKHGDWPQYLCESIETGELAWWSNVGIEYLDRDVVNSHPDWRWTDRQYKFKDRWRRVCFKERDAYITMPTMPIFGDDFKVTLGTRTRFGFDDHRPTETFADWRKVTKAMMLEFYDKCVAERESQKTNAASTTDES